VASTFANFASNKTYGFYFDYGNFEKCINFESNGIQGRHCVVQYYSKLSDILPAVPIEPFHKDFRKDMNTRLVGGVCIPSTCNPNEIVPKLMEIVLNGTKYVMSTDYDQNDFCQTKKKFKFTTSGIFGFSILFMVLAMILFSTIKNYKKKSPFFSSFCIIQNFKNLFIDENRDSSIQYVRGIKTALLLTAVILHTFICTTYFLSKTPEKVTKFFNKHIGLFMTLTINGPTMFIFITTFMATRIFWMILERKGSLNLLMVYAYRYLRLTPVILFFLFIQKFIMEGWIAEILQTHAFFPKVYFRSFKYYWLPLLHIQNYFIEIRESVRK